MAENSKTCSKCKAAKPRSAFQKDRTRADGLTYVCKACRSSGRPRGWHGRPNINPETGRPGPAPAKARSGDKRQARHAVNQAVKRGDIPKPSDLPCFDCGHAYGEGGARHEYDHHLGYAAGDHLRVQAVCTVCHHKRDNAKAKQTRCSKGHEYSPGNTGRKSNGARFCRECRRAHDRKRRDAQFWRDYRAKKAAGRLLDGVPHNGMPEARHG